MNAIKRLAGKRIQPRGPTTSARAIPVTLYGKPGCHLCDDAIALLDALGSDYEVEVGHVDITTDPELFRSFDMSIPVIVFADGASLSAPIRETDLRGALRSRSRADRE